MNTNVNASSRIEWIDAAKGIGIIFVVLGHIWLIGPGQKYINSFHMPLFFFLSGYIFRVGNYRNLRQFVCSKVNRILIPYAWFSIFTYIYWVMFERAVSGNTVSPVTAFVNIFVCQGTDRHLPHNPALWFLPCLFIVEVMFFCIARNIKREFVPIILLISSIASNYITRWFPGNVFWSANVALTGLVFYGIGYVTQSTRRLLISSSGWIAFIFVTATTIGLFLSLKNTYVIMAACVYGDYFYFYLAAFLNITGIIAISVLLKKTNWLIYLGRNSLTIFALHFPIKRLVVGIHGVLLNIPAEQVKASFLMSSIDTIVTIVVLLPITCLIRRRFAFILGATRGC